MESYYTLLTDLPDAEFKPLIASNPRDAKVKLAKHLITWLHDSAAADVAEKSFMTATHGGIPDEMPELKLTTAGPYKLAPLLVQGRYGCLQWRRHPKNQRRRRSNRRR